MRCHFTTIHRYLQNQVHCGDVQTAKLQLYNETLFVILPLYITVDLK